MECKVTNLVHWSENIEIKEISSSNKCIICNFDIPKNTVLIIEQVFCDNSKDKSLKYILDIIRFSPTLYNSLYPRTKEWNIEDVLSDSEHDNNLMLDKIKYNAFIKNDNVYIGEHVTKSNHSLNSNAKAFLFDINDEKEGYPISYIAVVSTEDIKIGNEILIKYNNKINFDNIESINIEQSIFEMDIFTKESCLNKIKEYQTTNDFYFCRTNQIGVYYGAFCVEDMIFFNENFEKYMEKENIENTLENRRIWFENIHENIL